MHERRKKTRKKGKGRIIESVCGKRRKEALYGEIEGRRS
jgi:hypothetical protein